MNILRKVRAFVMPEIYTKEIQETHFRRAITVKQGIHLGESFPEMDEILEYVKGTDFVTTIQEYEQKYEEYL